MEDRDAEEFVLVLQGYYRLLTGRELFIDLDTDMWNQESGKPTYAAITFNTYTYPKFYTREAVVIIHSKD